MDTKETPATEQAKPSEAPANITIVRKFEIALYDEDEREDGSPYLRPVRLEKPIIVEASSPNDLKSKLGIYKQCGQVAKIVREIDPPSKEKLQQAQAKVAPAPVQTQSAVEAPVQPVAQVQVAAPVATKPPKYYKVGDIEIKDDNGKIYQKQWMKLTDSEAANIRVVNDKTNAIFNLNGKHLEMKRWILVETSDGDDTTSIEESLK